MSKFRIYIYIFFSFSILYSFGSISSFGIDERMYNEYKFSILNLDITNPVLSYQYSFRMAIQDSSKEKINDSILPQFFILIPINRKSIFGLGFVSSNRVPKIELVENSYKFITGDYQNGISPLAYNYHYNLSGGISKFYLQLAYKLNTFLSISLKSNLLFGNQDHSYQINYYDLIYDGTKYNYQLNSIESVDNYINFSGYEFEFENKFKIKNTSIITFISLLNGLEVKNISSNETFLGNSSVIHDLGILVRHNYNDNIASCSFIYTKPYFKFENNQIDMVSDVQFARSLNNHEIYLSVFNENMLLKNNVNIDEVRLKYGLIFHKREYYKIIDASSFKDEINIFGFLGYTINYLKSNSISFNLLLGRSSSNFSNIIFNISFTNSLKRLKRIKKER